jgi:hypothetical protein
LNTIVAADAWGGSDERSDATVEPVETIRKDVERRSDHV